MAMDQMKVLRHAIEFYRLDTDAYPEDLEVLTVPTPDAEKGYMSEIPLDPWKRSYLYRVHGDTYELFCAGRDGEPGTDDDIRLDRGNGTE